MATTVTTVSAIIPLIQASAEQSLFERVKNYFFPRTSTVKPLSNEELAARNYLFSTSSTPPSPVVSTSSTTQLFPDDYMPSKWKAVPTASNPVTFLNQVVNKAEHNKNVIAREEVATLSKPVAHFTSKELILNFLAAAGDYGATIAELRHTFPFIAPKGLSSRVSELVKAERVEAQKIEDDDDKLITVYFIVEKE